MLKELTVKEALQLLADKHPEPVSGWFWNDDKRSKEFAALETIKPTCSEYPFEAKLKHLLWKKHFAIEVPDEYRYMTQQECLDWACLHCNDGYQAKPNQAKAWYPITHFPYLDPSIMTYRTIKEVNGEIIYGEPQEFRVKV